MSKQREHRTNMDEAGAGPVFPKVLKCGNCGNENYITGMEDLRTRMLAFAWLESPPHPPSSFQFYCPNQCGSGYVSLCAGCRQEFHGSTHMTYGAARDAELIHARFGERKMVKIDPKSSRPKHKLVYKPRPQRRRGDSDGPIQASQ